MMKDYLFHFACHGYSLSDVFIDGLIKMILKTSTEWTVNCTASVYTQKKKKKKCVSIYQ